MNLSSKVMQVVPKLCLVLATLTVGPTAGGGACERGRSWWDRERGACIPCTRCEPQRLVVKLPCEVHRDTLCQTVQEALITWPFNTKQLDDTGNRDESVIEDPFGHEYDEVYDDFTDEVVHDENANDKSEGERWRWILEATAFALATCGCVVFFIVVLYFLFQHSKQWKVLQKAIRTDVQEFSAKLKLMEAGETPAEPVVGTDHHIYCNIHVAKDPLLGPQSMKKGLGNVYTQEKHPC